MASVNAVMETIKAEVDNGQGRRFVKVTIPIESTIGANSIPERLALIARGMGLSATHTSAGGWFAKSHIIVVEGACEDVLRWYHYLPEEVR